MIGFKKENELTNRVKRLDKLCEQTEELLRRIIFEGTEREALLQNVLGKSGFIEKNAGGFRVRDKMLDASDRAVLQEYLDGFGSGDLKAEENRTKFLTERLKRNAANARELAAKNGRLYKTAGLCGGAMLGIFLL